MSFRRSRPEPAGPLPDHPVSSSPPICAGASRADGPTARSGPLVLVGNPNVGKSVLFGALSRSYATVSNYPGTTVEIAAGSVELARGAVRVTVLDTPGTHSFAGASEDERVTRDLVLSGRLSAAVLVADAKNVERALLLAVPLSEMGVPFVMCLNMMDEADSRGLRVHVAALAAEVGVEVVPTVATRRTGIDQLRAALERPRCGHLTSVYPRAIEQAVERLVPLLPDTPLAPRGVALALLSSADSWPGGSVPPAAARAVERLREEVERALGQPAGYAISRARLELARAIASRVVRREKRTASPASRLAARLDRLTTHPIGGLALLGAVLYAAYQFVGVFGAGTLVDLLEDGLFNGWINPAATATAERWIPWAPARDFVVGPYGVLTMGLTYALALVLPIVGTFFVAFGLLEDSGYLPRLALMLDRVFRRMGLNGKAVLPMVLGLGCDTMATLTTRILETRKERLIVILLLALGVPCSAQLTVVLAMLGSASAAAMGIWLAVVAGVVLLVGRLAARLIPGRSSDFVLELPPLRVPRPGNLLVKTLGRMEWYLKEAVPLFVAGTVLLFFADRMGALEQLERLAGPVLEGALGLPRKTAEAFIVGFLRRDFGAAGLYHLADAGQLTAAQVLVAVVTVTLFVPCIANFFMMVREQGWKVGLAIAGFVFALAMAVGAALNLLLRAAPWLL